MTDARVRCLADERIDAKGANAMFCDDDMKWVFFDFTLSIFID